MKGSFNKWGTIYVCDLSLFSFLLYYKLSHITKFMGPTWGPPGSCRPQLGPVLAPWILLSGLCGLTLSLHFLMGNNVICLGFTSEIPPSGLASGMALPWIWLLRIHVVHQLEITPVSRTPANSHFATNMRSISKEICTRFVFCFAMLCFVCGVSFKIIIHWKSLTLGQSNDDLWLL